MEEKPRNKGGRPVGAFGKLTRESREKAMASGELPHEFLLRIARGEIIYRDEPDPRGRGRIIQVVEPYDLSTRIDAAKAAAPYFAPKISTVEVITGVPDNELDTIIAQLAAEAGIDLGSSGEVTQDEDTATPRRRVKLQS